MQYQHVHVQTSILFITFSYRALRFISSKAFSISKVQMLTVHLLPVKKSTSFLKFACLRGSVKDIGVAAVGRVGRKLENDRAEISP